LQRISESPIANLEGLSAHEVVVLAVIAENVMTPEDSVAAEIIKRDVDKAGFTKVAAQIGLTMLGRKGFATYNYLPDEQGESYVTYSLTEKGWEWILRNQDRFQIQKPSQDDDIPF
jgi:hypothetical protein